MISSGYSSSLAFHPDSEVRTPRPPMPSPAAGRSLRIGSCSRRHASHEYAVLPHPDEATSPGYGRVHRSGVQTPQRTPKRHGRGHPAERIPPSSRSGSVIPPGRSSCLSEDRSASGLFPNGRSSDSVHAGLHRNQNIDPGSKPFPLSQRSTRSCLQVRRPMGNENPDNNPSIHSFSLALHRCVHCFRCRTDGRCASDCKRRVCQTGHCVLSFS